LIEQLPSCVSVKRWVKAGDRLNVTTDLQTALGMVGLFDAEFDRSRRLKIDPPDRTPFFLRAGNADLLNV
jgi:hypothetical protein